MRCLVHSLVHFLQPLFPQFSSGLLLIRVSRSLAARVSSHAVSAPCVPPRFLVRCLVVYTGFAFPRTFLCPFRMNSICSTFFNLGWYPWYNELPAEQPCSQGLWAPKSARGAGRRETLVTYEIAPRVVMWWILSSMRNRYVANLLKNQTKS